MWLDLEMKIGPLVIRLGGICMNKHWISLYQNCWSVLEILVESRRNSSFFKRSQSDALQEKTFVVVVVVHHILRKARLSNIKPS